MMKKIIFLLLATLLGSVALPVQGQQSKKHRFVIEGGEFNYDGKPIQIHAGEMHYARIPQAYWRHRLQMLKGLGLNTVATYVFWNYHEPNEGEWNFEGNADLAAFLRVAQEEGLFVILRPGPYACAEWEFGGYPWWLSQKEGIEVRTNNPVFLAYTKRYLERLGQEVAHLQMTQGGPIIMVQAENEFGSYVSQRTDIPMEQHQAYNKAIKQQLLDAGFDVPLFTSDGTWLFEGGSVEGALPTANGEGDINNLRKAVNQYHGGQGPYMVAEFYPGWLTHWAEPFPEISTESVVQQTETYLQNNISFNFYMVHGGTNFGFTSGANYTKKNPIQPDLTSYDYGAPISEAGWRTAKYDAVRDVMKQYVQYNVPEVPAQIPVIQLPDIPVRAVANLLDVVDYLPSVNSVQPMTFEALQHPHGYVVYSRKFNQPTRGTLSIEGLRDYAMVYIDGEPVGELNRQNRQLEMDIDIPFNATLQLVVENMGRINYGAEIVHNTKGIISPVRINDNPVSGNWENTPVPLDDVHTLLQLAKKKIRPSAANISGVDLPLLYEGTFSVEELGDVFLDMSVWGKGCVFVNGINLGRFWKVGPQQTLYLPGAFLQKGENSIVLFDQANTADHSVMQSRTTPILDQLVF